MNYGNIKYCDIANGEGVRTSLFVSGCTHHCAGCFQPETWDFSYGEEFGDAQQEAIIESLDHDWIDGLSVLGGEPMEPENQAGLAPFLARVKQRFPAKMIWVYTGDVLEDLIDGPRRTAATESLLSSIDVLVDGPFQEDKKDITLRFCGSSNQRIIDVPKTLQAGSIVLWRDDPLFQKHTL